MCFTSFFQRPADLPIGPGVWGSSNDRLAKVVDPVSGRFLAREPGRVLVTFNRSVVTSTHLTVALVESIDIDVSATRVITNAHVPGVAPAEIPVGFYAAEGQPFSRVPRCDGGETAAPRVPFSCHVEPEEAARAFDVATKYDESTDQSYCTLATRSPVEASAPLVGLAEIFLVVTVVQEQPERTPRVVRHRQSLPWAPAFHFTADRVAMEGKKSTAVSAGDGGGGVCVWGGWPRRLAVGTAALI